MVEIDIDGKKVEVPQGSMVMEAANKADIYVPHFCYHKKLSIAANCRMCLVDVEKAPKPLPACATPVTPGMIVRTQSEKAVNAQKGVMEFLLINHPLDCPICDQGGECQLQDLAVGYGASNSRYTEEKRVVFEKNLGPLISAREMTRCIHCTRCVRFGQEVAGVMELGMANRGEHSEIMSFVGRTVDSELSGNMIDLCPVGALTSKPFRYRARTWELARRKSVAPHDSLGSNLTVQVKQNRVMRVLPLENEAINECWLSDKDRFSYEALNTDDRLIMPMVKQGGEWIETDWPQALEFVAHALKDIVAKHGANEVGVLATPHSTTEELFLLQKLARGLGVENIDTRLRLSDFEQDAKRAGAPWLGMPISEVGQLKRAFIIGSFLRKDHPLLSARIRHGVKRGLKLNVLHAVEEDLLMPVANRIVAAPSSWHAVLNEIAVAIAAINGVAAPAGLENVRPSDKAKAIAESLASGERKAVFLGNAAVQHPQASRIAATAQWIADQTGATLGVLTEAANTVGAYLTGAIATKGENAAQMIARPKKAYVLFNAEPELDCHDAAAARAAMEQAQFVVALSAFKHAAMEYATVMLPIAPFTETSGTFVNAEGRAQSFVGVVTPQGQARPGWKVLRVLGNLLEVPGFEFETIESVRAEAHAFLGDIGPRLNNRVDIIVTAATAASGLALERLAHVPIHHADAIVRRSPPLQKTADAKPPCAIAHPSLLERLGLRAGENVRVTQGRASAVLQAAEDATLPVNVVRVAASHPLTAGLGPMFGEVVLERA
ncbi:MAG TPA: NADH-quinone oxidoreductase subunit NuoG [Burkholderiaceae bacterium]|nr:NADH-quinone oxidoreductase subunit NuoG [Burkholderiaceae bacterium]